MRRTFYFLAALCMFFVLSATVFAQQYPYQKFAYKNYERAKENPGVYNTEHYKQVYETRKEQFGDPRY